jgi:hypothetical protein
MTRMAQNIIIYRAVAPTLTITNYTATVAIEYILPRYYKNYLTGINQESAAYLTDVTTNQYNYLTARIGPDGPNKNYYFNYEKIVLDLNTVEVFSVNNETRVRFTAAFYFEQMRRDSSTNWQSNHNVQILEMLYNEYTGEWLVDIAEIKKDVTIGTNQSVLY